MRESYNDDDIARLQNCLAAIRLTGGWSSETFGNMMGVSKSTISNLENGKVAMSKSRYESIRAVLNKESKKSKDNYLSTMISILTDRNLPESKIEAIKAFVMGASISKLSKDSIIASVKAIASKE